MTAADAILSNQNVAGAQHKSFSITSSEFEGAAQRNDVLAFRRFTPIERRMYRCVAEKRAASFTSVITQAGNHRDRNPANSPSFSSVCSAWLTVSQSSTLSIANAMPNFS